MEFEIENGVLKRYTGNNASITIPDGVTEIGSSAFENCINLIEITIPDSVTSIGKCAFEYCSSLTSVTILDNVTSIGDYAFYCCKNLTSIIIGNGVTSIGEWAFYGCWSLTSVTIPDSVTSIGSSAFRNCSNLTSVTIPDSVTSIGSNAFAHCNSLTTKKGYYKAVKIKNGKFMSDYNSNYEYKIGEWLEKYNEVIPCQRGYHFCDNLFNVFNYYYGKIDDIAIFKCEVGDIVTPHGDKFITNTIKLTRRLTKQKIIDILNNKTEV